MNTSRLAPAPLLAPLLLVMAVFLIGLADGVLQSFGYIPSFGLHTLTLDYYRAVLTEANLHASIGVSLYLAVVSASVSTILAVALSFALITLKKDRGFLYTVIRIPMFFPWIVTGLAMTHLLAGGGWLARLCATLGLASAAAAFERILYSPGQTGVIIALIWACTPFACFMIQTVMSQVTEALGEAAANLGATLWQRFWFVTLPVCQPLIRNTFLIVLVSCFGLYEIPALLGMTLPRALPVEIYYQYSSGDLLNRPYPMALNTIMLALALTMAGLVLFFGRTKNREEAAPKHER